MAVNNVLAQTGRSSKSTVEYTVFKRLQPGEKVVSLYSCLWLNEKNEFVKLVIQQPGGKYSLISGGERKDNLTMQQVTGGKKKKKKKTPG